MAIMIPDKPKTYDAASQEGLMFDALSELPDDYYVFHSFSIVTVKENTIHENETDFVIFNPKLGVLCIEAKSGRVCYKKGYWYYGNGVPMHNDGPFNQASSNKWKLMRYIENSNAKDLLAKCKFIHAVWFPTLSNEDLKKMVLPPEADKALILTKEALTDPEKYLKFIFSIKLTNEIETKLSTNESKRLIKEALCPEFNIFPTASFDADLKKIVFHRLLNEQIAILDFLEEQKTAAINGAAGTGKTMIAIEKAKRNAEKGQSVLFLCYNVQLKNYLALTYRDENIHFYTMAGFACKVCNSESPDYDKLQYKLIDMSISHSFPYKHVVIDEGQDFGVDAIEESDVLQSIYDIIIESADDGSFYIFYDRLQMIQSTSLPKYISEADCKLTLYRNCRNTENIATSSLKPINGRKPILMENAVMGAPVEIYYCSSEDRVVDKIDNQLESLSRESKDVVILTCKTEDKSVVRKYVNNGLYKDKYRFSTCRKFKGLEADEIILIDVDEATFDSKGGMLYYVGSSRARLYLKIVSMMSAEECRNVLEGPLKWNHDKIRKPQRELATALGAIAVSH